MSRIPKLDAEEAAESESTLLHPPVIGPFKTGPLIGEGSMAYVLEAIDTRTGEPVALKVLRSELNSTSEAVSRFLREGRALANLTHPNIVRVVDQGTTDSGEHYLALERLTGVGLDQLITTERRLDAKRAVTIAIDISKALATLHARGMFHRDIKPENIFIVGQGTVLEQAKLIDFGIAHVTDQEMDEYSNQYTQVGAMLGSAAFVAPEQSQGEHVDARADVFALVVTLYEMLTGKLPFKGDTAEEQIRGRLAGRPLPLDGRKRGLTFPAGLSSLVMRGLSANRELRPLNGLVLLRELQQCLAELAQSPGSERHSLRTDVGSNHRAGGGGGASGLVAGPLSTPSSSRGRQLVLILLLVGAVTALTLAALFSAGLFGH